MSEEIEFEEVVEDADGEPEVNDLADRLLVLIDKISNIIETVRTDSIGNRRQTLHELALYQSFPIISHELGFKSYFEFQENFSLICNSLINTVSLLEIKKEKSKVAWISSIQNVKSVFDAEQFGRNTNVAINECFDDFAKANIGSISEMLQQQKIIEIKKTEVEDALKAAIDVMDVYEKHGNLSLRASQMLKSKLREVRNAFEYYEDFGDEIFWEKYKVMHSSYMQTQPYVFQDVKLSKEAQEEINEATSSMTKKLILAFSMTGSAASIASLAESYLPLLLK